MALQRYGRTSEFEQNGVDTEEVDYKAYRFGKQFDNQRVPSGLTRASTEPPHLFDLRTSFPSVPTVSDLPAPRRRNWLSWVPFFGQLRARGYEKDEQRANTPTRSETSEFVHVPSIVTPSRRAATFPERQRTVLETYHVPNGVEIAANPTQDARDWNASSRLLVTPQDGPQEDASDQAQKDRDRNDEGRSESNIYLSGLDRIEGLTVDSGYHSQRTGLSESLQLPIRKYSQSPPDPSNTNIKNTTLGATDGHHVSSTEPQASGACLATTSQIDFEHNSANRLYQEALDTEDVRMHKNRLSWRSAGSSLPIAYDELFADVLDDPPVGVHDTVFYTSCIGDQFQVVESLIWLDPADLETVSANDRQIVEKRKRDLAPVLTMSTSGELEDCMTFESLLDPSLPSRSLGHSIAYWLLRTFAHSWLELCRLIAYTPNPVTINQFYFTWGYIHLNAIICDNWFLDINLTLPRTGKSTGQQSIKPSIRPSMSSASQDVPYFYQQIFARDSDIDSGEIEVYQLSRNLSMPGSVHPVPRNTRSTTDDHVSVSPRTASQTHPHTLPPSAPSDV